MFTRPWRSRSCCRRFSGTNTARDVALLRPQRKLAEIRRSDDRAHGEPQRAAQVVLPAVQRLDRESPTAARRARGRAAGRDADVRGERLADQRLAPRVDRGRRDAVKTPEAIVDAVHLHARRAPAARLIAHDPSTAISGQTPANDPLNAASARRSSASASRKNPDDTTRDRSGRGAAARDRAGCRAPSRRRAALRRAPRPPSRRRAPPRRWCASSTKGRGIRATARLHHPKQNTKARKRNHEDT